MEHFYDNSLQTGLMRDLAIDLEVLGEHLVLLGNQVCSFLARGLIIGELTPRIAFRELERTR